MKKVLLIVGIISIVVLLAAPAMAAQKTWGGGGDGTSWDDDDNWYPAMVPTAADDVSIDADAAAVVCDETFRAKSITLAGRETSTLTVNRFIYGTVSPDSTSDIGILNRSGGTLTLKGSAGVVMLQGQYKDSTEAIAGTEPSFMFWVE